MHQAIRSNNFDIIFSYASTFEILSKYLLFKNYKHQKKIKLIFTSEHLSEECIQNLIKIFPESQIIGEYGMAETGIIAYSMNIQDEYKVIWSDFIIQNNDEKILISEIANKHFPLINYCPDDQIILNDKTKNENSIFSFSNIKGKERPFIDLKFDDNTDQKISLIIFDHLFKNIETIFSVQYFINSNEDKLIIIFSGNSKIENLTSVINDYFKKKILNIELMKIQYPIKTKAGKFKTIIYEKDFSYIKLSS
jgi:phenylacetate-coenzyme A ligase PaaK-like adenylate-forming protein